VSEVNPETWLKLIERGGPCVVPLAGFAIFYNAYVHVPPDYPLAFLTIPASGFFMVVSGVLSLTKMIMDWPSIVAQD